VDGGRYAGGQQRGAGGGAVVAARIRHDPDPVLAGKHGANIEFPVPFLVKSIILIFKKFSKYPTTGI
jgi:hypothetical protein